MKTYGLLFSCIVAVVLLLQACADSGTPTSPDKPLLAPSGIRVAIDGSESELTVSWSKAADTDSSVSYEIAIYNLTLHKKTESDFKSGSNGKKMDALKSEFKFTSEMLRSATGIALVLSKYRDIGFLPGNEYIFLVAAKRGSEYSDSSTMVTLTISGTNPVVFSSSTNPKYAIVKSPKTWANAKKTALFNGVGLVKIDDAAEQTAIETFITSEMTAPKTIPTGIAADGGGIKYLWIGATDASPSSEGKWIWNGSKAASTQIGEAVTGGLVLKWTPASGSYENWGKKNGIQKEPDNYMIQNYAGIAIEDYQNGSKYQWNDISGTNNMSFIVEY